MQGQRSTVDSFPDIIDFDPGSVSTINGMNQQTSWNSMLNPVESRLQNPRLNSGDANISCMNVMSHDNRSLSGYSSGEPSSSSTSQKQVIDDEMKMGHDWSSASARGGTGLRLEERQFEPANMHYGDGVNLGLSSNPAVHVPLYPQSSTSTQMHHNFNLHGGYLDAFGDSGQGMGAGIRPSFGKPSQLEMEQIPSSHASDGVASTSGSSGYLMEGNDDEPGSSLGSWGLSCKRKALEGTSGQAYSGGSSSCFSQAENSLWRPVPPCLNASSSLSISRLPEGSPGGSALDQMNPRTGSGGRGGASDGLPSLSISGNSLSSLRNFSRRLDPGQLREPRTINSSAVGSSTRHCNAYLPHQLSGPPNDALNPRSVVEAGSTTMPRYQPHVVHVPIFSRNVHHTPWNGTSSSRTGSSSRSLGLPGQGPAIIREESSSRGILREQPMFPPATETRNLAQDSSTWNLGSINIATPGGVGSVSQAGPSSGIHGIPTPGWIPHANAPVQNQHRLSDFAPWTLFPSLESDSGVHNNQFAPQIPGLSVPLQEAVTSSGANRQGHHHQQYPRSAILGSRQNDEALDRAHSWRAVATDIEGRQRLLTEIRHILTSVRRGESIRMEDMILFDPSIYQGIVEVHDRHRDMRLDVDNMSYEELLALEERIGDVNTGLSEETIMKSMRHREYISISAGSSSELEPCCICQEEYGVGDDLGILDCGHDFHVKCIKQWLMLKNLCPICKTTALFTGEGG
ncbi:Zinc finger, RING-type [Dillenia turbinata]|uniref:RING-type E3 ubiquitin transferase n=1 Tax=Dillenia turbinata TaxID=194707 RepID=A0AAN8YX86_9MAGN